MSLIANVGIRVQDQGATANLRRINDLSNKAAGNFHRLQRAVAAVGLTIFARQSVHTASRLNDLKLRLRLLSSEYGEYAKVQKIAANAAKVFGMSNIESLDGIANIYARLRPLNIELADIQSTFIGFNAIAKMSGISTMEAAGAFRQLSQALGSGRLQGDEYRSMAENLPGLMRLIADELGVEFGQLKKLASESKITTDVMIRALKRAEKEGAGKIADIVKESDLQKFKTFRNTMEELHVVIGQKLLPVVTPLVAKLVDLIRAFTKLPEPIQLATVSLVGLLGITAIVGPSIIGLAKGFGAVYLAIKTAATATAGGAALFIVLKVALVKLLLPIAAVAGGIWAVIAAYKAWQRRQKKMTDGLRNGTISAEKGEAALTRLEHKIKEVEAAMEKETNGRMLQSMRRNIARTKKEIDALNDALEVSRMLDQTYTVSGIEYDARSGQAINPPKTASEIAAERLAAAQAKNKALAEQLGEVYTDVAMTIKDGVVEAIQGAIDGTKTLGEVAVGILKSLQQKILDIAVNMALFGAVSGAGSGGGLLGGLLKAGGAFNKASGGPVKEGRAYKVAERGPETFIPSTKGQIVASGGGNITVNVDATGSEVEGDEDGSYELGKMIGMAVQNEIIAQQRPGGLLSATV